MKTWMSLFPKAVLLASAITLGLTLVGCRDLNALAHRQDVERANLNLTPLVPSAEEDQVPPGTVPTPSGLFIPPPKAEARGAYTFTTPVTVTRVKRTTGTFEQYQIYEGQPATEDVPFITIWVGKDLKPENSQPNSVLKVDANRTYLFNGLITQEWIGYTSDKHYPFVELLIKHPGDGDLLHVIAIAKNPEIRESALNILGTIRWTENP